MIISSQPPIPQADPKAGYLAHKVEIDAAFQQVLDSGRYILGREVEAFEKEFAAYIGVRYAIGVGNGTDALELALRACGIGQGDGVFTVSHTAVATVAAIARTGATPSLLDIDITTYTLDPNCLKDALKKHTGNTVPKAIVPVHLYGNPADLPAILDIARRYHLYVIEDCAQSHGATLEGCKTGNWGDIAAFSFYPTKNLGALGDGGMVVTNNLDLAEKVQLLRQYGWINRSNSKIPGGNSRLDELQAAILRVKLRHLDHDNKVRQDIAAFYHRSLVLDGKNLPHASPAVSHVYHQYVIRTSQRDKLRQYLAQNNVGTGIHYPQPVHLQPGYQQHIIQQADLSATEKAVQEILSLPMYPQLQKSQIERVAELINTWFDSR